MPFPILAHQAPILPLKLWRARWFSTVALCAGSMAPDVDLAVRIDHAGIGHSVRGQFLFCLPIALVVTVIVARVIGPVFGARPLDPLASASSFGLAVSSALVGSFSHIGLDALTHRGLFLQLGVSLVGAIVATVLLVHMTHTAQLVRPRHASVLVALPLLGAGLAVLGSRYVIRHATYYFVLAPFYVVGYVAFRAFLAAFVGLTLASLALRLASKKGTEVAH